MNRVQGIWHVKDVGDVIRIFFECNSIYVEDRSNTLKGCNAMYVEDVEDGKRTYTHRDVILTFFECNSIYVKDVEDRSNTPKGCNAMYVEDVKD